MGASKIRTRKDTLTFELLTSDTDQSKKLAEYIQGTLQQTLEGLTVEVTNVPFSVRLDRSNSGDFEMVMNNWIGDYADPINFLELFKKIVHTIAENGWMIPMIT